MYKRQAFQLDHGEAKVLITDREFSQTVKAALASCKARPLVIDYDDPEFTGAGERLGNLEYEDFLREGDTDFTWLMPHDEWDAIALNYTSGTTGDPKGVVYHHRGAYLLAIANVITCAMGKHPVYLWTVSYTHLDVYKRQPPYQIHILPQRLDKLTLVGTTVIFYAFMNMMKIVPYFALGQFSTRNFATSIALLPLAVAANLAGIWLVRRTPTERFYQIAYLLMFLISLALLWQGWRGL